MVHTPTVSFITLGCKVNASETEGMRQLFEEEGYLSVTENEIADVVVINTCTVTQMSDKKSRQMIRKARSHNPDAILAAVGCYIQVSPEVAKTMRGVDVFLGNNEKHRIVEMVQMAKQSRTDIEFFHGRKIDTEAECFDQRVLPGEQHIMIDEHVDQVLPGEQHIMIDEHVDQVLPGEQHSMIEEHIDQKVLPDEKCGTENQPIDQDSTKTNNPVSHLLLRSEMQEFECLPINKFDGHSRAFIKIQDGCNQFCSYCIIPYARGPVRSRDSNDIIEEIARLVNHGYSEVVLTGIHLTSYNDKKYGKRSSLVSLVQEIQKVKGIERIRFGSLEPLYMGKAVLEELNKCDKFCPHFHLSLQSGCRETLKRMNRNYTPEEFSIIVKNIRKYFPDVTIATDIMVGFPGETEDEFSASYSFCENIEFSWMHVFPYSIRKGTLAAGMEGKIDTFTKTTRAKKMKMLANRMKEQTFNKLLNQTKVVLFEQKLYNDPDWMVGYTSNYIQVAVKTNLDLKGQYRSVYLEHPSYEWIQGTIVGD